MKYEKSHYILKNNLFGGAKNVVLKPYDSNSSVLLSKEVLTVIDLLSEGPVAGLVDKNGKFVEGNRAFSAIYFNDTPIKITNQNEADIEEIVVLQSGECLTVENTDASRLEISQTIASGMPSVEGTNVLPNDIENAYMIETSARIASLAQRFSQLPTTKRVFLDDPFKDIYRNGLRLAFVTADFSDAWDIWGESITLDICYSGDNGVKKIGKRYMNKNGENESYFDSALCLEIPEPMMLIYPKLARLAAEGEMPDSLTGLTGFAILPLASGDEINVAEDGHLYFSGIATGSFFDPESREEMLNSKIVLRVRSENLKNTFNFEKVQFEFKYGNEKQSPISSDFAETSRPINIGFKMVGAYNEESFYDGYNENGTFIPLGG